MGVLKFDFFNPTFFTLTVKQTGRFFLFYTAVKDFKLWKSHILAEEVNPGTIVINQSQHNF